MKIRSAEIKRSFKIILPALLFICAQLIPAQLFSQKYDIIEKKTDEVKKAYEIHALYPQMKKPKGALMGVSGMVMDFNTPIEKIINTRTAEFKAAIAGITTLKKGQKSSLSIGYQTIIDSKNIYSVKLETFSEAEFAAHPNTFYDCYNFDYVKWTAFALKDIFLESSPYLNYISDYCRADLKNQAREGWDAETDAEIDKGASADAENFKTYNISQNSLEITFQYYQVGPRIIGAPVVSIPFDSIKTMINPSGPLGYVISK